MKYLIPILLLMAAPAMAVDPTIDPIKTLSCTMPVEREDGTALAVNEIAEITFFVSTDQVAWTQVGSNTVCSQQLELTNTPDGQYYYVARTVDTDGRVSRNSNELPLLVKRLAPPAPPTSIEFRH